MYGRAFYFNCNGNSEPCFNRLSNKHNDLQWTKCSYCFVIKLNRHEVYLDKYKKLRYNRK